MATMVPLGNIYKQALVTATLSPAQVAGNTTAEQAFTVPGIPAADTFVFAVSKPTAQAGLGIVGWRVTAQDTVGITFSNNTASPITPTAAENYHLLIMSRDSRQGQYS